MTNVPGRAGSDGGATTLPDDEVVARIRAGRPALFEILMRRHNQRLSRTARAIVRDEADAEEVLQQAYLLAFTHLHQFEGRASVSTWLTRIVITTATRRRRSLVRTRAVTEPHDEARHDGGVGGAPPDPEHRAYAGELRNVLEQAVDGLPDDYRLVFMLREVEGLNTADTADALGIGDEAVKSRLHRGRAMLRRALTARLGQGATEAFPFHAPRCDRVVAAVMRRIAEGGREDPRV